MERDLESCLKIKFPELLRNLHNRSFPHPIGIGIQCGKGWWNLIAETLLDLEKIRFEEEPSLKILCIKEHFGGLKVRAVPDNLRDLDWLPKVQSITALATECSYGSCELCSREEIEGPTQVTPEGFAPMKLRTLCESCLNLFYGGKDDFVGANSFVNEGGRCEP